MLTPEPKAGFGTTLEAHRSSGKLSARLAKKRKSQSHLGRISADVLLSGRGADLGAIPEMVALLARSNMLGPSDPLECILNMTKAGLQSRAIEFMEFVERRKKPEK